MENMKVISLNSLTDGQYVHGNINLGLDPVVSVTQSATGLPKPD